MAQPHYVQTLGTYATDYLDEQYPRLMHHAKRLRAVLRRDEYYGPLYFAYGEWCSPFDEGAVQFDYVGTSDRLEAILDQLPATVYVEDWSGDATEHEPECHDDPDALWYAFDVRDLI